MGKKTKIGKARKDKFYHLAKETGYRSRAAFKLIQLNRKYQFLQGSRVLIDLCAAPGGWLQVAKQFMPVSSIIVGVDLAPIKSVHNVITLQDDITTDHCRQALRQELKTWSADVVLHDGAPNVGKNWYFDAFTQVRLTLSAFKLASEFLVKGGWFVTKVFRSRDYHALLWVLQQFFKKVDATKPPASRNESAEIFVICKGYTRPDKIDPKLLDPRHVFEEVQGASDDDEDTGKNKLSKGAAKLKILMEPKLKKKSAEGYAEGKVLLLERLSAREYMDAVEDKSKELLSQCHQITIDQADEEIAQNAATTPEIRQCCEDIKVLGKREIRLIIAWRKAILADRAKLKKAQEALGKEKDTSSQLVSIQPFGAEEEAAIQAEIDRVEENQRLEAKRKRKRLNKLRKQLQDRMNLKMLIPGDTLLQELGPNEERLFGLDAIHTRQGLEKVEKMEDEPAGGLDDDWEEGEEMDTNPLLVGRESKKSRRDRMTEDWFNKDIFQGINLPSTATRSSKGKEEDGEGSDSEWESDAEEEEMQFQVIKEDGQDQVKKEPVEEKPVIRLDAEGFALAEELIKSRKRKREIMEAGFHREAFSELDSSLPSWFVEDEKKFCRVSAVDRGLVTKEQVAEQREKLKEMDARPIKKVAEAQARKKRRTMKRLEKARKKAGKLLSDEGEQQLSAQEKMQQLKSIYKKAGATGKKKTLKPTLVFSKKGGGTSRSIHDKGQGGRVQVVDRRMKKDLKRGAGGKKKAGGRKGAKAGGQKTKNR